MNALVVGKSCQNETVSKSPIMQKHDPKKTHLGMVQVAGGPEHSLMTFVESRVLTISNYLIEISVQIEVHHKRVNEES